MTVLIGAASLVVAAVTTVALMVTSNDAQAGLAIFIYPVAAVPVALVAGLLRVFPGPPWLTGDKERR
jgi:ABC-type uncharacterized transport system permease subunit